MKVLLTSTSFQDTAGEHQKLLKAQNFTIESLRGPLPEKKMLEVIANFDAVICGDDEYTEKVLEKGRKGKLKYISKYGVGLDKINLKAAKKLGIPVTNCPGVNQVSVAEHVLALIFTFEKNIHLQHNTTQKGSWKRLIGNEVFGKTLGIIGLGAIGKELAKKANALGLSVLAYDINKNKEFLKKHSFVDFVDSLDEIYSLAHIISLHIPYTPHTDKLINDDVISYKLKKAPIIVNTARGKLVDSLAIIKGIKNNKIKGYLTDVLEYEPMIDIEPLKGVNNVIITPHIGSRTYQSIQRQGVMAVNNLLKMINDK